MFITATFIGAWLGIIAVTPVVAHAGTVNNTVVIKSESSSAVVTHGTHVRSGTSSTEVRITSVVNGETVLDIHETSSGEPIDIRETVTTEGSSATAQISVNAAPTAAPTAISHTTEAAATTKERKDVDSVANAPATSIPDADRTITIITNTNSEHVLNTPDEAHTFMQAFFTTFANTLRHVVSLFT